MKKLTLLALAGVLLFTGCQDLTKDADALISDRAEEIANQLSDEEVAAEVAAKAAALVKAKKAAVIEDDANFDVTMDILEESRGHFINHFVSSRLPGEVMYAIQNGETTLYLGQWDGLQWVETPAATFWRNDAQLVKFEDNTNYLTMFTAIEDEWGYPCSFADCLSAGTYYLKAEYNGEVYKGYFELTLPTIVKDYLESIKKNLLDNIEINGRVFDFTSSVAVVPSGEWAVVQQTEEQFYKHIKPEAAKRPETKYQAGQCTMWSFTGVFYPGRKVKLGPFQLGQYEVTRELYNAVMGTSDTYVSKVSGENFEYSPKVGITWTEAVQFCNKLSELMDLEPCYTITSSGVDFDINKNGWRLPTEAEWEFSARGGNPASEEWNYAFAGCDYDGYVPISSSNYTKNTSYSEYSKINALKDAKCSDLDEYVWYTGNNRNLVHQVGLKKPNSLGLYDMSGNVFEWCQDWYSSLADFYDAYYKTDADDPDAVVNPFGGTQETFVKLNCNLTSRTIRTGAWFLSKTPADQYLRNIMVTSRDFTGSSYSALGFRLARTITE